MKGYPSKILIIAKSAFLLFLFWVFITLITKKTPYIFIDNVNLLIHESGHLVFNPFGEFIGYFGGTLMQLIVPAMFTVYFLFRNDYFGASFCLFWFGENFINISYYIADAKLQMLPLIGGGNHDWGYILGKLNLIDHAALLGSIVFYTGSAIMLAALVFQTIQIIIHSQPEV